MSVQAGAAPAPAQQPKALAIGLAGLALLATMAAATAGWRQGSLAVVGFAAGVALYHAAFGFTSAWRALLTEGRSVGVRAQLLMLALTIPVFFPLLAAGSAFGQPLSGFVFPAGLALVVGAFLFGIGMQLGGGCGSGTLFTVGGGSPRMLATLLAFIAGSTLATANPGGWMGWPDAGAHSLVEAAGWPLATATALAALGIAAVVLATRERRTTGELEPLLAAWRGDALTGPWPLAAGALALALVNIATLLLAGRPWGITSAFALWGAKVLTLAGMDVAAWPYWQGDPALTAPLLADATSVMNLGLMTGAFVAAALAGKLTPWRPFPVASLAAAVIGGLLMGVGARLATGCNIGAFFSGIASGSLHGLVWLALAVPGNLLGVKLRPLFFGKG